MGVIRKNATNSDDSDSLNLSIDELMNRMVNQFEGQSLYENGETNDPNLAVNSNSNSPSSINIVADGRDALPNMRLMSNLEAKRAERKLKKSSPSKFNTPTPVETFRGLGKRGKSDRKHRRLENGNMLAKSLCDFGLKLEATSRWPAICIDDFVPQSISPFARLLMEKEHMKAWNDFIQCSEEEQEDFLRLMDSREENEWVTGGSNDVRAADSQSKDYDDKKKREKRCNGLNVNGTKIDSNFSTTKSPKHPAFCPDMSFNRIDSSLKKFLRQKRIPMNLLEQMEDEISIFFQTEPVDAIYESYLPTGFQRLLLHATSQYLNLVCKSFDRKGSRFSQVYNENEDFMRPTMKLAEYLESPKSQRKFSSSKFDHRPRTKLPHNFAIDVHLG